MARSSNSRVSLSLFCAASLLLSGLAPALAQNYSGSGSSYYQPPASQQGQPQLQPLQTAPYNTSGGNNYNTYTYQAPQLQGRVSTAPAGSQVAGSLQQSLNSEYARVGDQVSIRLSAPLFAGNSMILPAGTLVEGQVASAKSAGRVGGNGEIELRFTQAQLPNGSRLPISARVQTTDGSGVIKAGTTANRVGKAAVKTGVGAGAGALLGTALGPLSGGSVGRGAIFGTALGAAAGGAKALWDKGEELELGAGSNLTLVLDQPVTVTDSSYDADPYGSGGSNYTNYNSNYSGPGNGGVNYSAPPQSPNANTSPYGGY